MPGSEQKETPPESGPHKKIKRPDFSAAEAPSAEAPIAEARSAKKPNNPDSLIMSAANEIDGTAMLTAFARAIRSSPLSDESSQLSSASTAREKELTDESDKLKQQLADMTAKYAVAERASTQVDELKKDLQTMSTELRSSNSDGARYKA
eukprot:277183-Prymnesium_polylepis.1